MGRRCRVSQFSAYSRTPWQQSSMGAATDYVGSLILLDDDQVMRFSIITGLAAFFFKHSKGLTESPKALPADSSYLPVPNLTPYPRPSSPADFLANLTFVPDQVVAKENEQDEQQEDDKSHDPTNNGMVGAGG